MEVLSARRPKNWRVQAKAEGDFVVLMAGIEELHRVLQASDAKLLNRECSAREK